MRVFVTGTGRCGSCTFYQACKHITNYTCGHETYAGGKHLSVEYPDDHIEVSPHLVPRMEVVHRANPGGTVWVHLVRERGSCVRSLVKECKPSMIYYAKQWNVLKDEQFRDDLSLIERVAGEYYDAVNARVAWFLGSLPLANQVTVSLESPALEFSRFWEMIGAEGDLSAALTEFDRKYNPSGMRGKDSYLPSSPSVPRPTERETNYLCGLRTKTETRSTPVLVEHRTSGYGSTPKLSVLVAALHRRTWEKVINELLRQREQYKLEDSVEILVLVDGGFDHSIRPLSVIENRTGMVTGHKRQKLLEQAEGEYVCYVDDDDRVAPDYLKCLTEGIEQSPSVVCFDLVKHTANTLQRGRILRFALQTQLGHVGQMTANHLCAWRKDLSTLVPWCKYVGYVGDILKHSAMFHGLARVAELGKVPRLTQVKIDKPLYFYDYDPRGTVDQSHPARTRTFDYMKGSRRGHMDIWVEDRTGSIFYHCPPSLLGSPLPTGHVPCIGPDGNPTTRRRGDLALVHKLPVG